MSSPSVSIVLAVSVLIVGCGEEADESAGSSTSEAATGDGEPDCGDGEPWIAEPGIDLDTAGAPTAEEALRPFLEQWQELFGGEVVMVGDGVGALRLDGSEVVVAYTVETNGGGFAVNGSTGCDSYEPDVLPGPPPGGPATIPP